MTARSVRSYIFTAACVALLVAAIVTPTYFTLAAYCDAIENGEYGRLSLAERGDFWGGYLGGPMAFVGAMLFLIALMMQRHELSLQRQELADSRKVYQEQADQLRIQADIARSRAVVSELVELSTFLNQLERDIYAIDQQRQAEYEPLRDTLNSRAGACKALIVARYRDEVVSAEDQASWAQLMEGARKP